MSRPRVQFPAVIIVDEAVFSDKLARLRAGGAKSLQVIADFDKTLSTAYSPNGACLCRRDQSVCQCVRCPLASVHCELVYEASYSIHCHID